MTRRILDRVRLNKSIAMMATALAVGISGVLGFATTSRAAESNPNTSNTQYYFDNTGSTGATTGRVKYTTTKVYVYPTLGPKIKYTVQGSTSKTGTYVGCSNTHGIAVGVQASITNYVSENGYYYARLYMTRYNYASATTTGAWSPDSTKNYTIYN
jgi:hypothetical protein